MNTVDIGIEKEPSNLKLRKWLNYKANKQRL